MSVLLPPGTYTVKLSAAGKELTQPLIVTKDPNSSGTEAEVQTQVAMLLDLRSDLEKAAGMVNQIELIRSQLYSIISLLAGGSDRVRTGSGSDRVGDSMSTAVATGSSALPAVAGGSDSNFAPIKAAVDALDIKLIDIEENLIQRKLTGQGQDTVRWPPKLLTKINYLANGLSGSDFGPTTQQREVHALFKQQLSSLRQRLDDMLNKDLDTFNKLLRDRGIQNIMPRLP